MRLDIRPACLAGTLRRRGIAVQAVEPFEQLRAVGDALGSSRLDQVAGFPAGGGAGAAAANGTVLKPGEIFSFNSFSHAPVFSYISLVFHVSSSLTSLRFNNSDAIMIFLFPVFTINCVLQDPMKYTLLSILA